VEEISLSILNPFQRYPIYLTLHKILDSTDWVRVDRPHESFYWRYLGDLTWTLNHKVTFTDRLHHFGWAVTFLEKETQLIWKVNKVSYLSS